MKWTVQGARSGVTISATAAGKLETGRDRTPGGMRVGVKRAGKDSAGEWTGEILGGNACWRNWLDFKRTEKYWVS